MNEIDEIAVEMLNAIKESEEKYKREQEQARIRDEQLISARQTSRSDINLYPTLTNSTPIRNSNTRYSLQSCFAKALELEGEFMVGEVVAPRYHQASILGVEGLDPTGGEGACEVKHQTDQGKGDLYNPNECWRCRGMGHFARECTQDANPTRAIGKLHHTLEAETLVARSLLTEFFNKLMRVQRKHDIVQAKLKKERQEGKGGTPRGSRPEPKGAPAS